MSDDELNNLENEMFGNAYKPNNTEKTKTKNQSEIKKVDTFERMMQEMENEVQTTLEKNNKMIKHPDLLKNMDLEISHVEDDDEAEKILQEAMKTNDKNKTNSKKNDNKINKVEVINQNQNTQKNGNVDVIIKENGKIDNENSINSREVKIEKEEKKQKEVVKESKSEQNQVEEDLFPENLESKTFSLFKDDIFNTNKIYSYIVLGKEKELIESVIDNKKKQNKETIIWDTKLSAITIFMSKIEEKVENGEIDPVEYIANCKKIKNDHLKIISKINEVAAKYRLGPKAKENVIKRLEERLIYYDQEINQEIPPKDEEEENKDEKIDVNKENKDENKVQINEKEEKIGKSEKLDKEEPLKVSSIKIDFLEEIKFPKDKDLYPFNFESKLNFK